MRRKVFIRFATAGASLLLPGTLTAEHSNDLWLGSGMKSNGISLIIYAPESFTSRVEVYFCSNLRSNVWSIAAQNLRPVSTNPATWTVPSPGICGFFCSGNMDVDSDGDLLPDARETIVHKTLPDNPDTDGDGMPDGWELQYGFNPLFYADGGFDFDLDGLRNIDEYLHGTRPDVLDTDGDGMPDGWEVAGALNPLSDDSTGDPDGDGVTNLAECTDGTHPQIVNVIPPGGAQGRVIYRYDISGRLTDAHFNNQSAVKLGYVSAENITANTVFTDGQ